MELPTNAIECLSRLWPLVEVEDFLASYDPIFLLEYTGPGAEPISEEDLQRCGGEKKRAQAVRIYDRLGRLAENTRQSYQTYVNHFKAAIDELNKRPEHEVQPLSYLAHPVSKVADAAQIVVDHLLKGSNLRGSMNSFSTAMVKLRECQLGIPRPGSLKDDAWFKGTLDTAGRVTAKRRLAPEANSLLGTEETTTLKPHEYEKLIDSCIMFGGSDDRSGWLAAAFISFGFNSAARCSDLCTMKYKALFLTTQDAYPVEHCLLNCKKDGNTKTNKYGEFRASACGRNRNAHLDAHGSLADLMVYDALAPGRELDFGDLVLNRREEWRTIPLFHQNNTVSANGLTTLLRCYLSKAGLLNEINRIMHLMRNTAAIRAGAHNSADIVELLGEWKSGIGTCAGSYLSKSQSSALPAHLALAGFKGPFDHYLWRADAEVPDAWVDVVMPGVRSAYKTLLEQHQGLKCQEKEIGAETFLSTLLYLGKVFWQNLPLKYRRYKECYTLAHLKGINSIMQTEEYRRFAEDVLDKERRSIEKVENKERIAQDAPPKATVEVPKASTKVYVSHSIAFGDCKTCSDLWDLWEQQRPIINKIIESADTKQKHPLTVQKGRLKAVVQVITRLSEEKSSLQHGIQALQQVLEEFDCKEDLWAGDQASPSQPSLRGSRGLFTRKTSRSYRAPSKEGQK
jgi:hypothetical protein